MEVIKVSEDCDDRVVSETQLEPTDDTSDQGLVYGIDGKSTWYLTPLLAVQNVVTTISCLVFVYNILAPKLCILPEDPARAHLLATAIMIAGIGTALQTLVGVRLPIVQTSGFVYLSCTLPILEKMKCPSNIDLFSMGPEKRAEHWNHRVQDIQGAMIIIGIVQVFLGYSGCVGKALKYITPLTIVPTMCLIGLSVIEKGVYLMSGNWITAVITLFFLTLFSQYLRKIVITLPVSWYKDGMFKVQLKIFALFSILLSMGIVWIGCVYLTFSNKLSPLDPSNTDSKSGVFRNSPMFTMPYPFQWGFPTFRLTTILAMLPALFANIVESVANYYTCARFSDLSKPPPFAVNRGIGVQGISTFFAGIVGTGSGVSASSENVGNIGITRVCSRNVVVVAGCIMFFLSLFPKLIALMIILPDPVLGAMTSVLLVLIGAVALSNLQFINLNSLRNMYILGLSLFFGLGIPKYAETVHGYILNTRYESVNEIASIFLSSGIFISGFIGFILDNTIPADDDGMTNSNMYHHTGDNLKSLDKNVDEQVYKISDKIHDRINNFFSFFM